MFNHPGPEELDPFPLNLTDRWHATPSGTVLYKLVVTVCITIGACFVYEFKGFGFSSNKITKWKRSFVSEDAYFWH